MVNIIKVLPVATWLNHGDLVLCTASKELVGSSSTAI